MTKPENIFINFWWLAAVFSFLLGSMGVGFIYTWRTRTLAQINAAASREAQRPAQIEAIVLNDKNCADCFDPALLLDNLARQNVSLEPRRTVERESDEGRALIEKFAIVKLPTVILRGELNKDKKVESALAAAGEIKDNEFILRQVGGPYVVPASGEIKGRTDLLLIADKTCDQCYDVRQHLGILNSFGLYPRITEVDIGAAAGKKYLRQFGITEVPTFVLQGQIKEFSDFVKIWPQVGIEKNGAYVFTKGLALMGIYKDLKSGKLVDPKANVK